VLCFPLASQPDFFQLPNPDCCLASNHGRVLHAAMDSRDITPTQAARLCEVIAPQLRYVGRLCARMKPGLPAIRPLYRAASKARNATSGTHVTAHYCRCTSGVGK